MKEPKAHLSKFVSVGTPDKFIDAGIPVSEAKFIQAVDNAESTPETYFSKKSSNSSRNSEMWWTSIGLVCLQREKYFVVPFSNIKFAKFDLE